MSPLLVISRHIRGRAGASVVVATLGVLVLAPATVSALRSSEPSAQAAKAPSDLDHFKCYVALQSPEVRHAPVTVKDQFGESKIRVQKTAELCNPASKNGSRILHKTAHLVCYETSEIATQPFKQRTVQVTNQFGVTKLTVVAPANLCVPSLKNKANVAPRGRIPETLLDHFRCYDVKKMRVAKTVKTSDQFKTSTVSTSTVQVISLCLPVSKNQGIVRRKEAHLVCYSIKPERFSSIPVRIRNQFGLGALRVNATKSLCLPSFKQVLAG
jgi:hypothetical protein